MKIMGKAWAVSEDPRDGMEWNTHIVLAEDYDMRVCFMANGGEDGAEEFAKAAFLIAAAPDLYNTLAELLRHCERQFVGWPVSLGEVDARNRAVATLAKARGETL